MAKLLQAFDATKVDPTQGAGQLPIGRHPVIITESDVEGTKGGGSGMLVLTLKIIDGPQTGTTGPYRLNLYNQNPQASQIAERQLSAICHAIGVLNVTESEAMHAKPFMVDVGFQKGQEPNSGPDAKGYTEVKKVYDINGVEPGKKGQTQGGQGQQNNNGGQFDNQMADAQRKEEQRMAGGPGGGSAQNWGNNNANQGGNQTGNNSGNWGNNGGQQTQQNQGGNGGGWGGNNSGNTGEQAQSNGGNGWGNQGTNGQNQGNANQGGNGGNGGGSWQQNTNGAQGNGWGQRN